MKAISARRKRGRVESAGGKTADEPTRQEAGKAKLLMEEKQREGEIEAKQTGEEGHDNNNLFSARRVSTSSSLLLRVSRLTRRATNSRGVRVGRLPLLSLLLVF